MKTRLLCIALAFSLPVNEVLAQNVVSRGEVGPILESVTLTETDALALVRRVPDLKRKAWTGDSRRVADKLARHVSELLDGQPWRPFHFTHGISGYEAYFTHPDEMFYALSLAAALLPDDLGKRVTEFLAARLKDAPPYAEAGFDPVAGKARERYDVPEDVRQKGPFRARSLLGVYAFWAYVEYSGDREAVKAHWPMVKKRIEPVLANAYTFDIKKRHTKDEAERLNGDLSGLIGFVPLARATGDADAEKKGLARLRQVLELRVNLERTNPRVLEPTESTTGKLHVVKFARYNALTPEIGAALQKHSGGTAAERLTAIRDPRPGWWLAAGDRLIGGENYTSPPHLSRALFAGAALVEGVKADELTGWVDVPWCRADLYFIEKASLVLWATNGRGWR